MKSVIFETVIQFIYSDIKAVKNFADIGEGKYMNLHFTAYEICFS